MYPHSSKNSLASAAIDKDNDSIATPAFRISSIDVICPSLGNSQRQLSTSSDDKDFWTVVTLNLKLFLLDWSSFIADCLLVDGLNTVGNKHSVPSPSFGGSFKDMLELVNVLFG